MGLNPTNPKHGAHKQRGRAATSPGTESTSTLWRLLAEDPSWKVRLQAARVLPLVPRLLRVALGDPHWRPRAAAIERLYNAEPKTKQAVRGLDRSDPRIDGAVEFLEWLWRGAPVDWVPPEPVAPQRPPFWSDDPAVLERRIKGVDLRAYKTWLPTLFIHEQAGVRTAAIKALRRWGSKEDCLLLVAQFTDPRTPHALDSLGRLVAGLDQRRLEPVAKKIIELGGLFAAVAFHAMGEGEEKLAGYNIQMHLDDNMALAGQAAQDVLALARPEVARTSPGKRFDGTRPDLGQGIPQVTLAGGAKVSRLGLSGHYGLPEDGYSEALERGVNFFFWEPGYSAQSRAFRRMTANQKASLTVLAGSFGIEPKVLKRAVQGALRNLQFEQLGLFFLFWVRDPARLSDEVRTCLEQLKATGDIGDYGFSTHQYELAEQALSAGWQHVMVRHNIAHRTAEQRVLPLAVDLGASVITFSNLCYGRALGSQVQAVDLYRFTLETHGVAACLTAPSTVEQLRENLQALSRPMTPQTRAALLAAAPTLRAHDQAFARCVRWC